MTQLNSLIVKTPGALSEQKMKETIENVFFNFIENNTHSIEAHITKPILALYHAYINHKEQDERCLDTKSVYTNAAFNLCLNDDDFPDHLRNDVKNIFHLYNRS